MRLRSKHSAQRIPLSPFGMCPTPDSPPMLRACFVCLPAASVIDPTLGGPIGGTETRAWLFARTLARRDDTQVTFVVRNRELMDGVVDGVTIRTHVDRVF